MNTTFQITPQSRNTDNLNYILIPLEGHLNEESICKFELTIEPLLQGNHSHLVFDLGSLQFLNTRVIGYLLTIHKRSKAAEKRIAFLNNNEVIFDALEMAGLNELIPIYDEEEAFINSLQEEALV
jgi:anti-anti-sigma factor